MRLLTLAALAAVAQALPAPLIGDSSLTQPSPALGKVESSLVYTFLGINNTVCKTGDWRAKAPDANGHYRWGHTYWRQTIKEETCKKMSWHPDSFLFWPGDDKYGDKGIAVEGDRACRMHTYWDEHCHDEASVSSWVKQGPSHCFRSDDVYFTAIKIICDDPEEYYQQEFELNTPSREKKFEAAWEEEEETGRIQGGFGNNTHPEDPLPGYSWHDSKPEEWNGTSAEDTASD